MNKQISQTLLLLMLALLAACAAPPLTPSETSTPRPPTFTAPPSETATLTLTATASATFTVTPTETRVPTSTRTPTITPTATFDWNNFSVRQMDVVNMRCVTPKSLMLHANYTVHGMEALADKIIELGLETITYQDVIEMMLRGECPGENTIIVSLDDISSNNILLVFRAMMDVFVEHDLKLVVGVNTPAPGNSDEWAYLRSLAARGFEIASHTVSHQDLTIITGEALDYDVNHSYDEICKNIGQCPVSLIIPFGSYNVRIPTYADRYTFMVGISGGYDFGTDLAPYYIGRSGPIVGDTDATILRLERTYDVNR